LLTWFIKGGRIISTGLLLIFIFLLTKSTRILKPSLNLSYGNISLFLSAISFLLIIGIVLISSLIKKERCIIKN
jgi:hypothetical protein